MCVNTKTKKKKKKNGLLPPTPTQEASHRTSLLALEIDEQSVRQERSSRELLRAVEERCAEQVRGYSGA